jgi:hypothetical protein
MICSLGAVSETESHLIVSDSLISHLLPADFEDSPIGTVVEAFKLFFISDKEVPRFTAP